MKRMPTIAAAMAAMLLSSATRADEAPAPSDAALRAAVGDPGRSPRMVERDAVRHPLEELAFFGLKPSSTVVEIWPAGGYWTEILAPYLRGAGTYYAALETTEPDSPDREAAEKRSSYFIHRLDDDRGRYGRVKLTRMGPGQDAIAPAGSVDLILSFRDLHVWMKQGFAEQALVDCYTALKPGGMLAMEDHRGHRSGQQDVKAGDGYVREDYAKGLAELAGFVFVASSEIEANPKDTADWPKGVWTLPPTLALGNEDRDRYTSIGEPDNFVLLFRKPE